MFRLGIAVKNLVKPTVIIRRNFQVTVVGASCPLGQSASLLLKQHPLIHRLALHDVLQQTPGIATDLSHIPREPLVEGWTGRMSHALRGCDLVVVTGGKSRKEGQTDLSLFSDNVEFIISAMQEVTYSCPNAFIAIATEPINYIVPLACKVLESGNTYDKNKVLGVTRLATMRTQSLVGSVFKVPPNNITVPVVGGHSSRTIIPLLSHMMPRLEIDRRRALAITESVRNIDNIKSLTYCGEKSKLSMAYATYCTASAILDAMNGITREDVAFVANNDYETKFFATPVIITKQGITARMHFDFITRLEADYIYEVTKQLGSEVRSGELSYTPLRDSQCKRNRRIHTHTYSM